MHQFSEFQSGQRSLLGRLQHDRVAASQRRTHLPRRQQQRKIPRNNQTDHAHRLAQRVGKSGLERVDGFAVNLRGQSRVVAQDVDHHRHIDVARFENRLAVVEGFQFGEFVDILLDQIGKFPDQASALAGGELAPGAVAIFERPARGVDGAVDIRRRKLPRSASELRRSRD